MVAVERAFDRLVIAARVLDVDLVQAALHLDDVLRMTFDVRSLSLETARWLVNHDAGIRQRITLACRTGGQEQRAHRSSLPHAKRGNRRTDELHRVIDRHAGGYDAARRIDVHVDLFLRVFCLEKEKLCANQHRHSVFNRSVHEDDALLEKARENIIGPFATVGLLNHHRDEVHDGFDRISHYGPLDIFMAK